MRAIGYVRVSTDEQATEGLSLQAQESRLRAYCDAQEWTLEAVFSDAGVSASTLDRSGLQQALTAVEEGRGDVLLALKLDRLTRSVVGLYELIERCDKAGVRLAAVQDALDTGTANGRMVTSILAVLAQWEREIVSERTAEALAQKKRNGEHVGAVPYGFRRSRTGALEIAPDEIKVVTRIKRMRRRGASYREIAVKLNAEGVDARRGNWGDTSIRRLVNDHLRTRKAKYLKG